MSKRYVMMINNECNFNCKYCFQEHSKWEEVDPDIVKTYFPPIGQEGTVIHFMGGEPLKSWDYLKRLIVAIYEYNPNHILGIVTNGSLLTEEMVEFFNKYDVAVDLSHDGNYHEITRGFDPLKGKEDLFMNLKYKRVSSIATSISFDYYNFWDYFDRLTAKYNQPRIYHKVGSYKCANGLDAELMIKPCKEFEQMLDKVFENLYNNLLRGNFDCHEFSQYRTWIETIFTRLNYFNGEVTGSYCGVDTNVHHMDIYGRVYNCYMSKKMCGTLDNYQKDNPYVFTEKCQNCDAYIYCGGGCFINPPQVKEWECWWNKTQFYRLYDVLTMLSKHNIEVMKYDNSKEFGRKYGYNLF